MKQLNLSKILNNFLGNPIYDEDKKSLTYGRALSAIIINHRGKKLDQFKLYSLAQTAFKSEEDTSFDDADFAKIKEIILADESCNAIISGPVLAIFQ